MFADYVCVQAGFLNRFDALVLQTAIYIFSFTKVENKTVGNANSWKLWELYRAFFLNKELCNVIKSECYYLLMCSSGEKALQFVLLAVHL